MFGMQDLIDQFRKLFCIMTQKQFEEKYQDYQIIGSGSYGTVMRAKNLQGQYVAIKQFKKEAARYVKQTIRQIMNLKKLNHANIVKYYQCYLINQSSIYLVTEYCPEGNLKQYIEQGISDFKKMQICQQIAQGLAYAHQENVIHRDLKPDNIFMGKGGVAKIGDFGCSTEIEEENQVMESRVGSPAYMDVQVMIGSYSKMIDIYSLGMIFVCIYKGKGIYDECLNKQEYDKQMSRLYKDYNTNIENYLEGVCPIMREIIKNCLMRDESKRYSANEIAKKIKTYLQSHQLDHTSSSKAISTQDYYDDETYVESNIFTCHLIHNYQKIELNQRIEKTKKLIFQLLVTNEKNIGKLQNIQSLLFVKEATKAQFTFFVLFYYNFWLLQIKNIASGKKSSLQSRYQEIDSSIINQKTLDQINDFIDQQTNKTKTYFMRCAKLVLSQLKLMESSVYMPDHFKDIVTKISLAIPVDYHKFDSDHLMEQINTFFEKRIQKQYYHNWDNKLVDKKLAIIQSIGLDFI